MDTQKPLKIYRYYKKRRKLNVLGKKNTSTAGNAKKPKKAEFN